MTKSCDTCGNHVTNPNEPMGGCKRRRVYASNEVSAAPEWGFPCVYETDDAMWIGSIARAPGDVCGAARVNWTPKKMFKVE